MSIFTESWLALPEQQHQVIGDPEAPGPDTPSPETPGGRPDPHDPTETAPPDPSPPGGRPDPHDPTETAPPSYGTPEPETRDRQTRARETREKETGSIFGKSSEDKGVVETIIDEIKKVLTKPEEDLVIPTPWGVLMTQAAPQIANEFRSLLGLEEDRFPDKADPTGGEGGAGPEGRDGGTREEDKPNGDGDGDGDKHPVPDWASPEYRDKLKRIMEDMLGRMPDGVYEVPDWKVLISVEAPASAMAPLPDIPLPGMGQAMVEASYNEIVARLDEDG